MVWSGKEIGMTTSSPSRADIAPHRCSGRGVGGGVGSEGRGRLTVVGGRVCGEGRLSR